MSSAANVNPGTPMMSARYTRIGVANAITKPLIISLLFSRTNPLRIVSIKLLLMNKRPLYHTEEVADHAAVVMVALLPLFQCITCDPKPGI